MMNHRIDSTAQSQTKVIPAPLDQSVEPAALGSVRVTDLMKAAPSLAVLAVGFLANSPLPEFISSYGGKGH